MLHRRQTIEQSVHGRFRPGDLIPPHQLFSFGQQIAQGLSRERISAVPYGPDHVLSRMLGRYIFLTSIHDTVFCPHLLLDGYWEMWLSEYMVRTIQSGWTCLDIGANYGYFSVLMADLVGQDGHIISVEPGSDASACAQFSLAKNGFGPRSTVHEAAASSVVETVHLYEYFERPSDSHIVTEPRSDDLGKTRDVGTVTIDDLCRDLDRVDFIKLDAEGAEAAILSGATETLDRHNPQIVVEFSAARSTSEALASFLSSRYEKIKLLNDDASVTDITLEEAISSTRNGGEHLLIVGRS